MALSARLQVRQTQSLVITPQLMQAIRLLQMSGVELDRFVAGELEQNPLLDADESAGPASADDGERAGGVRRADRSATRSMRSRRMFFPSRSAPTPAGRRVPLRRASAVAARRSSTISASTSGFPRPRAWKRC